MKPDAILLNLKVLLNQKSFIKKYKNVLFVFIELIESDKMKTCVSVLWLHYEHWLVFANKTFHSVCLRPVCDLDNITCTIETNERINSIKHCYYFVLWFVYLQCWDWDLCVTTDFSYLIKHLTQCVYKTSDNKSEYFWSSLFLTL